MDSIIDSAIATAAGTLAKDLEPAAVATLQDLKTFVHGQADRLRTALPALEQKALEHVRGISNAVLAEYDNVLARIDSHLTGAAPAVVESNAGSAAVAPVDPTQAPTAAQATPTDSSTSSTPPSTDSVSATTPATDTTAA